MGSSGADPCKGIDLSGGGLVWVRRINGSWWPGRILDPDELLGSDLQMPRSGTPVKLLGREDATVDWYNLEKSKTIKAFRCGEYNDCIEKAKASASNPSGKEVKYAKRENAIIHALKLESARLGKVHQILGKSFEDLSTRNLSDLSISNQESEVDLSSGQELSQSGVSFEEPDAIPFLKRKRSQHPHVHEFLKRKKRSRTLAKVLECTPMVSVTDDESSRPFKELEKNDSFENNNNSDSTGVSCNASLKCKQKENEISSEDHSFEMLFDVPLVAEEKPSKGLSAIISSPPQNTRVGVSSQSSHMETKSLANDELNESSSISSDTADIHNTIKKGTSKWQLRGNRNFRSRMDEDFNRFGGPLNYHVKNSRPSTEIPSQRLLPYRQSRCTLNPKYGDSNFSLRHHITSSSGLYDVTIEVKTTSRDQHVPYISLVSKLNGRPIVGHPIVIEKLKDGFCDDLIRVPCKHCPLTKYRGSRRNGLLSKKTRKLSSLTGEKNQESTPIMEKMNAPVPAIACVPLEVVFSRFNAAMNSLIRHTSLTALKLEKNIF